MTDTRNVIDVLVGQNVRRIRESRSIDAASLADCLGVTHLALLSMEAGRRRFSAECIWHICRRLEIAPSMLYEPAQNPLP